MKRKPLTTEQLTRIALDPALAKHIPPTKQSTMQHTPGPWRISSANDQSLIVAGVYGIHIARAVMTGMGYTGDANANLIATAPELLEILEALLTEEDELKWPELTSRGFALIRKAKGGA